jgi:hypothetical protein
MQITANQRKHTHARAAMRHLALPHSNNSSAEVLGAKCPTARCPHSQHAGSGVNLSHSGRQYVSFFHQMSKVEWP